jgi:hypothetical protein
MDKNSDGVLYLVPKKRGDGRVHERADHAMVQAASWRVRCGRIDRLILTGSCSGVRRPLLDRRPTDCTLNEPDWGRKRPELIRQ